VPACVNCDKASLFVNLAPDTARFGTMVARNHRPHVSLGDHARGPERERHPERHDHHREAVHPPPSCGACPDRAAPHSAWLRTAPLGLPRTRGAQPAPWAKHDRWRGGLGRALPGWQREKDFYASYPFNAILVFGLSFITLGLLSLLAAMIQHRMSFNIPASCPWCS
jgi:hypothetical protein